MKFSRIFLVSMLVLGLLLGAIGDYELGFSSGSGVTQPIKITIAESGAPLENFTVSGCVTPTNITDDGTVHNIDSAFGTCLLAQASPTSTQRTVFPGGATLETFGASTLEQNFIIYYQFDVSNPSGLLLSGTSTGSPFSVSSSTMWVDYGTTLTTNGIFSGAWNMTQASDLYQVLNGIQLLSNSILSNILWNTIPNELSFTAIKASIRADVDLNLNLRLVNATDNGVSLSMTSNTISSRAQLLSFNASSPIVLNFAPYMGGPPPGCGQNCTASTETGARLTLPDINLELSPGHLDIENVTIQDSSTVPIQISSMSFSQVNGLSIAILSSLPLMIPARSSNTLQIQIQASKGLALNQTLTSKASVFYVEGFVSSQTGFSINVGMGEPPSHPNQFVLFVELWWWLILFAVVLMATSMI
ncbi:MAG: hypothetical protein ACREBQ_10675, partial [Nitrososphaerales archaeon]